MSRASVLVVDDEELVRWSLDKQLSRQGHRVLTAATGAEALRTFAGDPTDVVLLDINLPDGSGVRLIPEILTIREDTAVIMITSVTALETAVESVRLGAWDYITKPFDLPKLYMSIAKARERMALREENRTLRSRERAATTIVAASAAMRQVLELAALVARSDASTGWAASATSPST